MYKLGDVERLLSLPRSTIRGLIRAGFVMPARGPRKAQLFSFQDLIVFRTAQSLVKAGVPQRNIARAMRKLRGQSESGQYALAFGAVSSLPGKKQAGTGEETLETLVNRGVALHEAGKLEDALALYRGLLDGGTEDPLLLYNLGVLLEDMGRIEDAVIAYRAALQSDPRDADCHYNLALLYEALGKSRDALRHMAQYRRLTK